MTRGWSVRLDRAGVQWFSQDGERWHCWVQTPLGPWRKEGAPEWP